MTVSKQKKDQLSSGGGESSKVLNSKLQTNSNFQSFKVLNLFGIWILEFVISKVARLIKRHR
ncbi:TPA: hypothetical protein DEA21_05175 [Candidatus Uhrbacteria bacterium]|nr:hypothetical protein [Candidatus Uhrbacteria bacterium]HCU31401.1 hypothetical protein [Candidatus Uhrbacteria bacterium]